MRKQELKIMNWQNRDSWMGYATVVFILLVIAFIYIYIMVFKGGVITI